MRISIINHLACPVCRAEFLLSTYKKTKGRVFEGELKCKGCSKRFYIKNGVACFVSYSQKHTLKNLRKMSLKKMRKITIEQEIPRKWMRLYSEQEIEALKKEWNWMLSIVKKTKDIVHLDFATGTGRFLRNIIPKTKGEIIVLDFGYSTCLELQYFLKKIKKYNRVSIVCADARKMPFKDGVFDSVTSWHGLDEPKMGKVIQESRRVLKNGAWLAASGLHYQKRSKSFLIAKKEQIRFITKEAIIQALRTAGFRRVKYKTFFQGKWNEKGSFLPVFGDFYLTYAIKAEK